MGTTTGAWPVVNAAFSQANGKQFIAKLTAGYFGLYLFNHFRKRRYLSRIFHRLLSWLTDVRMCM